MDDAGGYFNGGILAASGFRATNFAP